MPTWLIVLLIIIVVLVVLLVLLYFAGKKLQKKQAAQEEMLQANKQTVSLLIIDKKRIKVQDAKLPDSVMSQLPKIYKQMKAPMVKVKAGPQIMTLFCDEKIFDYVPVKKEGLKSAVCTLSVSRVSTAPRYRRSRRKRAALSRLLKSFRKRQVPSPSSRGKERAAGFFGTRFQFQIAFSKKIIIEIEII